MATGFDDRPFSRRLDEIRRYRGYRYVDLENVAKRQRSSGWFNKLLTGWSAWSVGPPPKDTLDAMAVLLETSQEDICRMIAEEWYGVVQTEQTDRVASLAPRLDALTDEDADLVEELVQRLLKDRPGAPVDPDDAPDEEGPPRKTVKIKKRRAA